MNIAARNAMRHKLDEETTKILQEAAKECSAQAVRQVRQHKLVLTVAEHGQIVEISPEGDRKVLKDLPSPRLGLTRGTTISYR
jgi:protein-tyrosine-phosphatase